MTVEDDGQRAWMRQQLDIAAEHFSLTLSGEPVFGWRDRTIGSRTGDGRWLRVSWSQPEWAHGEWWTGNADSAQISGIPKPAVLDSYDWEGENYRNRAEIMTLVEDKPCSATPELRSELDLPESWFADLRQVLDKLAEVPTERGDLTQDEVSNRLLAYFGSGVDPTVGTWTTAHNDLNWSNITAPRLVLLDWESWGVKMAGYDAASLYVLSLRAPDTAKTVHDTFADVLDAPDGRRAQLYAITRYLKRVEIGDFPDLADKLHEHAGRLLAGG